MYNYLTLTLARVKIQAFFCDFCRFSKNHCDQTISVIHAKFESHSIWVMYAQEKNTKLVYLNPFFLQSSKLWV